MLAEAATMVRITALSVTASARGHGVGRALVAAAERRAVTMGASFLEVGSGRRPERAAAHRFYPAMGFEDANPHAARYWKWLNDDGFRR
jgi:GNAT superfamily N-acetyltransferase